MRPTFLATNLVLLLTACQTFQPIARSDWKLQSRDSVIYCSIPTSTNSHDHVAVEINLPKSELDMAQIAIKNSDGTISTHLEHQIPDDGLIILPLSENDELAISLAGKPAIAKINANKELSSPSPCVQLSISPSQKPATCQAVGTPAEGWYQSGRVIHHFKNCESQTLSCGNLPTSGWYAQKKLNKAKISTTSCAGKLDLPRCHTIGETTGWYMNDALVSRDSKCAFKQIECVDIGSPSEGWVTFERSQPELITADNCQASRNISYLSR